VQHRPRYADGVRRRDFLAASLALAACGGDDAPPEPRLPVGTGPNVIVIFSDDQGYGDIGAHGQHDEVLTPNIDRLVQTGVLFTDGYVTAPQCSPSRASILTGRYQQRFGLDEIPDLPLPMSEVTMADRLSAAGYMTGMIGKWHLDPSIHSVEWARTYFPSALDQAGGDVTIPFEVTRLYYPQHRGFREFFVGEHTRYWASFDLNGNDVLSGGQWLYGTRDRVDVHSAAAVAFIERNHERPFFLYLAYSAPHTPLAATRDYLDLFPDELATRRQYALAMIAAMDAGVGRILDTLDEYALDEDTLIFFISDNGAPLNLMIDAPIEKEPGGWNGSLNTPFVGEKGMLSEGGIRVPFIARFKGRWPAGQVYSEPVSTLDVAATALALAKLEQPADLDGVDLTPFVTGQADGVPHEALYWRFWNQSAIRKGRWKYLQLAGGGRFLFDLHHHKHENRNLFGKHKKVVTELEQELAQWASTLHKPGIPTGEPKKAELEWYAQHFGYSP
jgi:arylsulfatase A-like enzyme